MRSNSSSSLCDTIEVIRGGRTRARLAMRSANTSL